MLDEGFSHFHSGELYKYPEVVMRHSGKSCSIRGARRAANTAHGFLTVAGAPSASCNSHKPPYFAESPPSADYLPLRSGRPGAAAALLLQQNGNPATSAYVA